MTYTFVEAVWPIVGYFEKPVTGQHMQVALRYDAERELIDTSLLDIAYSNQPMRIAYLGAPDVWHRDAAGVVLVRAERMEGKVGESLVQPRSREIGEDIMQRCDRWRDPQPEPKGTPLLQAVYDLCYAKTSTLCTDDKATNWPRAIVALGRVQRRLQDAQVALFKKPLLVVVVVVQGQLSMPTPYDPGYRPRCLGCPVGEQELQPCAASSDSYSGFHACPRHPNAEVRWPLAELLGGVAYPHERQLAPIMAGHEPGCPHAPRKR